MYTEVKINSVFGKIKAPASKSCMQRALAITLLTKGTSSIYNLSACDDVRAAMAMVEDLGAEVIKYEDKVSVTGTGIPRPVTNVISCGESGLASRLFIPLAALSDREITVNGHGTILSRNMDHFAAPLTTLGARYSSSSGFLPVTVKGPVHGGKLRVDGKMSSQFLSGLLIALPLTGEECTIEVGDLASKPYVDITIDMMRMAGVTVINNNYKEFIIRPGSGYKPFEYIVEGDWSGASVLLVLGAVGGIIAVSGLQSESFQADRKITDVLKQCGAKVEETGDTISVAKTTLSPFIFDATDAPDLVPALAVLALACKGRSVIEHIERLRVKESDRVLSISGMIKSLGGKVMEKENVLLIDGGERLRGGTVDSFNDHRIVMAASAASVLCDGPVLIKGSESVNKSYPDFFKDLERTGEETVIKNKENE